MKADLALSKELSSTPRSKTTARQYKPWTSRKKRPQQSVTPSSMAVGHASFSVTMETPVETTQAVTIEAVPVEE